jgi:antitoxin component YwqK of YwqJK toxin-antitoxin module
LLTTGCDKPLSFDAQGVAHGTGERVYTYKSGTVQLREDYADGKLVRSRWFKPDGTLIQQTDWDHGNGEGIYLREDGSIRRRMQFVNGLAEGPATEYDAAGNVVNVVHYRAGQKLGRE